MTPDTQRTKSDPITIKQPGMRMMIAHRLGVRDNDEELTFDITTAGVRRTMEKEFCASIVLQKPALSRRFPENIRFTT